MAASAGWKASSGRGSPCRIPWHATWAMAIVLVTLIAVTARAAPATDLRPDAALEARVQSLAAELRCLVCQNQSLADSNADLAIDLKNQVREQLRAGRSESEVMAYMTNRYGDFVRYRPPFKATTLLLWLGPGLLLVGGAWALWRALGAGASGEGGDAH